MINVFYSLNHLRLYYYIIFRSKIMIECLRRHRFKLIFLLFIILLIIIIILAVLLDQEKHKNNSNSIDDQKTKITGSLSVKDLVDNWEKSSDWNITKFIYGKDNVNLINNSYIKVEYEAGSYANDGGFKFYSQPPFIFPSSSACFSYLVRFPNNFDFVRGGKLPGMWLGQIGANGGRNLDDGFSSRFMWRDSGNAEVYLYIPRNQTREYYNMTLDNNRFGNSLWRGLINLRLNIWNNMTMCIRVNNFNSYDGIIKVIVNNVTLEYNKLKWNNNNELISGLMMNTFFGGSDISWAPDEDTATYFANFTVWNF